MVKFIGCTLFKALTLTLIAPEGLTKPALLSETPTSVLVVWTEPEFPNGEITSYTIERRIKVKMFIILDVNGAL